MSLLLVLYHLLRVGPSDRASLSCSVRSLSSSSSSRSSGPPSCTLKNSTKRCRELTTGLDTRSHGGLTSTFSPVSSPHPTRALTQRVHADCQSPGRYSSFSHSVQAVYRLLPDPSVSTARFRLVVPLRRCQVGVYRAGWMKR